MKRLRIEVRGRVQGVGFRRFAELEALAMGISGLVRNEPDGAVAIEAEAPAEVLTAYLEQLRKGPRFSRVESLQSVEIPVTGSADFRIDR